MYMYVPLVFVNIGMYIHICIGIYLFYLIYQLERQLINPVYAYIVRRVYTLLRLRYSLPFTTPGIDLP